jgi:hypothetical protein
LNGPPLITRRNNDGERRSIINWHSWSQDSDLGTYLPRHEGQRAEEGIHESGEISPPAIERHHPATANHLKTSFIRDAAEPFLKGRWLSHDTRPQLAPPSQSLSIREIPDNEHPSPARKFRSYLQERFMKRFLTI